MLGTNHQLSQQAVINAANFDMRLPYLALPIKHLNTIPALSSTFSEGCEFYHSNTGGACHTFEQLK